jgi:myo-inositol 2-dehydrogenase/D-chiro-inositol 1-dehydrogenase
MTPAASGLIRRDFLKAGSAAALVATATPMLGAYAGGNDEIRVGIIGCGSRGAGAGENALQAAKGVKILAVGDFFKYKADGCAQHLANFCKSDAKAVELGNQFDKPEAFGGLDAYKEVINFPGVNYVILATPPGFRPLHLEAAVAANKHIFTEKPVAVDGPGVRTCLKAYEDALARKLGIVAGTQRRHQAGYIETIKRIHDGAIGPILAARCYWNQGDIWFRERRSNMTDLEYQIHNWYHFGWLCGDHICEQHVHNLDVVNWAVKAHPIRCLGMGGRTRAYQDPNVDGNIYNFFAVEYEYPDGMRLLSMCRQINGTAGNLPGASGVSEALVGEKGRCQVDAYRINNNALFTRQQLREHTNPYVQEHTDLIDSIRGGTPLNELKSVTECTLTAIMGRMSAYTGKAVSWDFALNSKQALMPENLSSESLGAAPLAVPGRTELI